jgi:GTP 3',8-cyclase
LCQEGECFVANYKKAAYPHKMNNAPLIDPFGRTIDYLRVSVTDRCDFRCVYCMAEDMTFLPKKDLLTLEELERLCTAFIARGTKKIRLTGGEPLVRRDVIKLFQGLSKHLETGALRELTATTNSSQLHKMAADLASCGVKRLNVSLDTLDPAKFKKLTRWGNIDDVFRGLDAADKAGISIKINTVALKGENEEEILPLVQWAHGRGYDITFIEVMPLGEIEEERIDQYLPLTAVRQILAQEYQLSEDAHNSGGPARYFRLNDGAKRVGFITPLTHNFCESCNRVRLTCTGTLYMCLGQEDAADLRAPLRASQEDALLHKAIDAAILRKPKGHDFIYERRGQAAAVSRHMSHTGG